MKDFIVICVLVTLIKLSLMNFYHSTDFEVHRNWLAITHSLPLRQWYTDATSPWTLDYPPAFAYFEWALSQIAALFDPAMLVVGNLDYASAATVLFQRLSVIATDSLLMLGTWRFWCAWQSQLRAAHQRPTSTTSNSNSNHSLILLAGAVLGNCGLLIVDHIHFQYNGMLFGLLLLSCAAIVQRRYGWAAFYFTWLLCAKHIFLYCAPVFGVYMLRFYVFEAGTSRVRRALRLVQLSAIVVAVVAIVFGPFVWQLPQLGGRLFPFKRGLTHAYWAPNVWALYNTADKLLALALLGGGASAATAGGLVSEFEHAVLPSVRPVATFALSVAAMAPCLWRLAGQPWHSIETPRQFIRALVLCSGASFLFGWHVHEKAILMLVIPLCLLAPASPAATWDVAFFGYVAHYSLFPLLDTAAADGGLLPLKYTLWLLWSGFVMAMQRRVFGGSSSSSSSRYQRGPWYELAYMAGVQALFVYEKLLHRALGLAERWPFVPLMLCSAYCALGVGYFWVRYYWRFMRDDGRRDERTKTKAMASGGGKRKVK